VVSVDLGIKKAAVAVLLTADGSRELTARNIRVFESQEKKRAINELDNQIAALQRKKEHYRRRGRSTYGITRKLKRLSRRRKQLARHYDHELTTQLTRWVQRLAHKYQVYVAIGQLKGIRNSRRKGDGKSRKHRRELHRWAFARITAMLHYKLQRIGVSENQMVLIRETWTSMTCCKCGSRNTKRPFQALLICHDCGAQLQADLNAAMNLAFKLICSLRDEVGLDQWLIKPFLEGKYVDKSVSSTGRKTSCTRKPSWNSRPLSGDELTPAVPCGEGTRNTTNRTLVFSGELESTIKVTYS
jgi:IS605 OrfB family transposase